MTETRALFSGLRVLDLTDEKGQLCGKIFADLGADVIKVEPPGGDPARNIGPFVDDNPDPEKGLLWLSLNTGKRSVILDLQSAEDRGTFRRLAMGSDLALESFVPGYLDGLGLNYESLSKENPALVMVSITPFGQTGPYSRYQGSDLICMAMSGEMNLCGDPSDRPVRISVPQAYFHGSLEAAVGALLSLEYRRKSGQGQYVDVAIYESVIAEGAHNHAFWYSNKTNLRREGPWRRFGHVGRIRMLHPCKDGHVVMYTTGGRVFGGGLRALVRWMDSQGMADDYLREFDWDEFTTQNFDEAVAADLERRIHPFLKTKTKNELWEKGLENRLVLAPVCTMEDIIKSSLFKERGFWASLIHADTDRSVSYPCAPYRSTRPNYAVRGIAPSLGQHNDILQNIKRDRPAKATCSEKQKDREGKNVKKGMIFDGLKILDLSWVVTGPSAVRFFADYGAEVIRVESKAQPDVIRTSAPFKDQEPGVDRSHYFALYNSNKYSITLDLKNPRGFELVKRLVAWADIVVEAFSPGVLEKMGLAYEALQSIKPDIILASTSQLGKNGPPFRGFGTQGAALAGFWSVTGYSKGEPTGLYGPYCDFVANRYLMIAILAALEEKRQTGHGQHIDQSQVESSLHFLAPALLDYTINGRVAQPQGNRDSAASPHNAYRCLGEDRWCAIAVFTDEQWQALKGVMGRPDWAEEVRFATLSGRKSHEEELDQLMDSWTSQFPALELMEKLQEAGVPAGIVALAEDLHNDMQLAHRGHFVFVDHPVLGTYASDMAAFRLSAVKPRDPSPSPCLGEHNEFVVREKLGLSHEEWLALDEAGAFG